MACAISDETSVSDRVTKLLRCNAKTAIGSRQSAHLIMFERHLFIGDMVFIWANRTADRFTFTLLSGPIPQKETKHLTLSCAGAKLAVGTPNGSASYDAPRGEFLLKVKVWAEHFEIFIDLKRLGTVRHASQNLNVRYLLCERGVDIKDLLVLEELAMPFRRDLRGGMDVADSIYIHGYTSGQRFHITTHSTRPPSTAVFTVDVLLDEGRIRGSTMAGDSESAGLNFGTDEVFELRLLMLDGGVEVLSKSCHILALPIRKEILHSIRYLSIEGTVDLHRATRTKMVLADED